MQYNLCIMDTLRLFISVLIIRVYLIIQVSLQVHAKEHFGSITKCVDYAGDLIVKYPDDKVQCMYICRVMHKRFVVSSGIFLYNEALIYQKFTKFINCTSKHS